MVSLYLLSFSYPILYSTLISVVYSVTHRILCKLWFPALFSFLICGITHQKWILKNNNKSSPPRLRSPNLRKRTRRRCYQEYQMGLRSIGVKDRGRVRRKVPGICSSPMLISFLTIFLQKGKTVSLQDFLASGDGGEL